MFFTKDYTDLLKEVNNLRWVSSSVTSNSSDYYSEKTDEGYVLELPVVGLTKEDLSIKISSGKLEIKGGKEDHRWTPSFEKVFNLPKDINTKKVEAKVENGLLTLMFSFNKDSETIVNII